MSLFWLHVRGAVGHTFNHKFSSFDFYVLILPIMPHHYCLINLTEVEIQGGFVYGGILQRSLVAGSKINTEIKSRVFRIQIYLFGYYDNRIPADGKGAKVAQGIIGYISGGIRGVRSPEYSPPGNGEEG